MHPYHLKIKESEIRRFHAALLAVAEVFDLDPDWILSRSRIQHIADARMMAMELMDHGPRARHAIIASFFNRERSTVTYAVKSVRDRSEINPAFAETYALAKERFEQKLKEAHAH